MAPMHKQIAKVGFLSYLFAINVLSWISRTKINNDEFVKELPIIKLTNKLNDGFTIF